jgi:hypothetical protein
MPSRICVERSKVSPEFFHRIINMHRTGSVSRPTMKSGVLPVPRQVSQSPTEVAYAMTSCAMTIAMEIRGRDSRPVASWWPMSSPSTKTTLASANLCQIIDDAQDGQRLYCYLLAVGKLDVLVKESSETKQTSLFVRQCIQV